MNQFIHNGPSGRQWNYLEVIDRASGETERIRLDDPNSAASVRYAAERAGLPLDAAWETLLSGGTIATFAFCRRLAK